LAIEWLASADRRPAWLPGRRYGFESWPTHDAAAYEAFIEDLPPGAPSSASAIASDIDEHELAAARSNASAAGLDDRITWHQGDFEAVLQHVPHGAVVLTNLPYGKRTNQRKLEDAIKRLGNVLRQRADLRPAFVLSSHRDLRQPTRLQWNKLQAFSNGGIRVRWLSLPTLDDR
jgi:23S rRNA G2445 N2-methylase RlmL